MKILKQITIATMTRREVVIGSVSVAAFASLPPAVHAAGDPTKNDGDSINNYRGEKIINFAYP
jgi:hypothetical protein